MFTVNVQTNLSHQIDSTFNNEQMVISSNGFPRTILLATLSKFVEETMFLFYIFKTPCRRCIRLLIAKHVSICQSRCSQHVQSIE